MKFETRYRDKSLEEIAEIFPSHYLEYENTGISNMPKEINDWNLRRGKEVTVEPTGRQCSFCKGTEFNVVSGADLEIVKSYGFNLYGCPALLELD